MPVPPSCRSNSKRQGVHYPPPPPPNPTDILHSQAGKLILMQFSVFVWGNTCVPPFVTDGILRFNPPHPIATPLCKHFLFCIFLSVFVRSNFWFLLRKIFPTLENPTFWSRFPLIQFFLSKFCLFCQFFLHILKITWSESGCSQNWIKVHVKNFLWSRRGPPDKNSIQLTFSLRCFVVVCFFASRF